VRFKPRISFTKVREFATKKALAAVAMAISKS
jgi:hypothetical protein